MLIAGLLLLSGLPALAFIAGEGSLGPGSGSLAPLARLSASFTFAPQHPEIGEAVTFLGNATGGTPNYTYAWDFGDGSKAAGETVAHAYAVAATYTVTLTVTDNASNVDSVSGSVQVTAVLTADFSYLPTLPSAGDTVTFTANPSGGTPLYTYSWTFGDGNTGTGSPIAHAYTAPNSYSVTLAISDSASHTASTTKSVSVTPALAADFTYTPSQPVPGQSVSFSATASGGTSPYSYAWDFGDGGKGTGASVTHAYGSAGTFSVTLTLSDSAGHTDAATKSVVVSASLGTDFTFTPTQPVAGETVSFVAVASGGTSPYTYSWDFGDGTAGSGGSVSHAYASPATYPVTVTALDAAGHTAQATHSVVVAAVVSVDFTFTPTEPVVGESVSFTGSASGGTASYTYTWAFGDGATGSGPTLSHVYATPGSYPVTVTATDSAGHTASTTKTVPVAPPIAPDFTFSPAQPIVGETVTFSGTASGGIPPYAYAWDFGDGSTGAGATASHSFAASGTFPVTLTVSDAASHSGSVTKSVGVSGGLTVDFTFSPATPVAGEAVQFSSSGSGGTPPYTYAWTFGDGSTGAGATVAHAYASGGVYTVTLVVTDSAAHSAQAVRSLSVSAALGADFTFDPSLPLTYERVNFTANATGGWPPYDFLWIFGDGYTGAGAVVSHTYTASGSFNVTLTAVDSLGRTVTVTKMVNVSFLLATDFTSVPVFPIVGQNVTFTAVARGANPPYTFSWAFGDGATAFGPVVVHAYAYPAAFTVTLTASDAMGHTATVRKPVVVTPALVVDLLFSPQRPLPGQNVSFVALPGGGTPPYTYAWDFGDGSNGTGATVVHAYAAPGNYTVVLVVTDAEGHSVSASSVIPVSSALVANFSYAPARPMAGETIVFTANVSGGNPPYAYAWDLGDGGTDVDVLVRHAYETARSYVVSLTVSDRVGHVTQVEDTLVVAPALAAAFTFSPTRPTTGTTVAFVATASGGEPPYTYEWKFGDGGSSRAPETNHTYSDFGLSATHTVVLTVCDAVGRCTSVSRAVAFQNLFLYTFLVELGLASPVLAFWFFTRRPRKRQDYGPATDTGPR